MQHYLLFTGERFGFGTPASCFQGVWHSIADIETTLTTLSELADWAEVIHAETGEITRYRKPTNSDTWHKI